MRGRGARESQSLLFAAHLKLLLKMKSFKDDLQARERVSPEFNKQRALSARHADRMGQSGRHTCPPAQMPVTAPTDTPSLTAHYRNRY